MKNNIKTFVIVFVFSIFSLTTFAEKTTGDQDLATFNDPAAMPGDPGVTPINEYIFPMIILAIITSCYLLINHTRKKIN